MRTTFGEGWSTSHDMAAILAKIKMADNAKGDFVVTWIVMS